MYGNMTREEMIQRLYEGNFTTGELERQLIAKLFEQCCGGGGSSGGGAFVVRSDTNLVTGERVLDKTAGEIIEASRTTSIAIISNSDSDDYYDYMYAPVPSINKIKETGVTEIWAVIFDSVTGTEFVRYTAYNDDDYPKWSPSGAGPINPNMS